jgi:hypothetical protein
MLLNILFYFSFSFFLNPLLGIEEAISERNFLGLVHMCIATSTEVLACVSLTAHLRPHTIANQHLSGGLPTKQKHLNPTHPLPSS